MEGERAVPLFIQHMALYKVLSVKLPPISPISHGKENMTKC